MKTRMERHFDKQSEIDRTKKNHDLYEDIYSNLPSSGSTVPNNESEIDLAKIKELVADREGYKRVKQYESIMKTKTSLDEEEEGYDIYEDIDSKIYDINMILEEAKSKRVTSEREKYRNLKNTQLDILKKLNLNEEPETGKMVTDFFTKDTEIKSLMTEITKETKVAENELSQSKTSLDLFDNLKGGDNTILTEAVKDEASSNNPTKNLETETGFYTSHLSFTQKDFEGFKNLQTTVKKNNRLIKVLITLLAVVLIAIIVFVAFTML